jgi:ankyrin repeat protein
VYSLTLGDIPSIAAFLDSGAVKLGAGVGKERMTPLHYASAQGNFELVEFLLERKAKV